MQVFTCRNIVLWCNLIRGTACCCWLNYLKNSPIAGRSLCGKKWLLPLSFFILYSQVLTTKENLEFQVLGTWPGTKKAILKSDLLRSRWICVVVSFTFQIHFMECSDCQLLPAWFHCHIAWCLGCLNDSMLSVVGCHDGLWAIGGVHLFHRPCLYWPSTHCRDTWSFHPTGALIQWCKKSGWTNMVMWSQHHFWPHSKLVV